jgi:hypothetical protein
LDLPPLELIFPITQLRDVRPARESAEVSVKHHQQPAPAILLEKVNPAFAVSKLEGDGRFSGQVTHVRRMRPSSPTPSQRRCRSFSPPIQPPPCP